MVTSAVTPSIVARRRMRPSRGNAGATASRAPGRTRRLSWRRQSASAVAAPIFARLGDVRGRAPEEEEGRRRMRGTGFRPWPVSAMNPRVAKSANANAAPAVRRRGPARPATIQTTSAPPMPGDEPHGDVPGRGDARGAEERGDAGDEQVEQRMVGEDRVRRIPLRVVAVPRAVVDRECAIGVRRIKEEPDRDGRERHPERRVAEEASQRAVRRRGTSARPGSPRAATCCSSRCSSRAPSRARPGGSPSRGRSVVIA